MVSAGAYIFKILRTPTPPALLLSRGINEVCEQTKKSYFSAWGGGELTSELGF